MVPWKCDYEHTQEHHWRVDKTEAFQFCNQKYSDDAKYFLFVIFRKYFLEFNYIRFIPKSALCGLPKLTVLNLTANLISSIEDLPLLAPCDVFIGSNQIVSLPDLFDKTLRKLYIGGNPFLYDQYLCWLRMLSWFKTLPSVDRPLCAQPPDQQGVSVLKVHPVLVECYRGKLVRCKCVYLFGNPILNHYLMTEW